MDSIPYGGPWTEDKLEILRRYLDKYTTALKYKGFRLIYVDAFAGPGWRTQKSVYTTDYNDFQELHKGSPQIALEVDDKQFDKLIFIEKDPIKVAGLNKLKVKFPERNIEIIEGDANKEIPKICRGLHRRDRAVVFLDPFATAVDWITIEIIAQTQKIDCWILFPLMAVTRMMSKDKTHSPAIDSQLDRIFGGEEWQTLYETNPQRSLLYDIPEYKRAHYAEIAKLYRTKLNSIFAKLAPTERSLHNSTGVKIFELFFAVSNPNPRAISAAINIADHILENW